MTLTISYNLYLRKNIVMLDSSQCVLSTYQLFTIFAYRKLAILRLKLMSREICSKERDKLIKSKGNTSYVTYIE